MPAPRPRPGSILLAVCLALVACGGPAVEPDRSPGIPSPTQEADPASPSASPSPRPSRSASASPSPTPGETEPTPTATPPEGSYTVQPGDSLSAIARRFGTSVAQLQAWNAERYPSLTTDPSSLQVGWVLVVAGDPTATLPPPPPATPAPTAPPPSAAGCRANNRVPVGGQEVFRAIPGAGAELALTFDMGGRLDPAIEIMSFLVANGVCATIFPTGAMSQTPIGREVLAIIAAHPELFEVGNHTMHHCNLRDGGAGSPTTAPCAGGRPSAAFIQAELLDAAAILAAGTAQDPIPYWRPPYGAYDQAVLDAAAAVGYTKTFMWDIDTVDWKPVSEGGPTAQQIANGVVGAAVNGSNVLMHLGGYNTLAALELMVPALRARGFTLTSLSDLLN